MEFDVHTGHGRLDRLCRRLAVAFGAAFPVPRWETLGARAARKLQDSVDHVLGRPSPELHPGLDLFGLLGAHRGENRWFRLEHRLGIDLPPPLVPTLPVRVSILTGFVAFLVAVGLYGSSAGEILGLTATGAAAGFAAAWPFRYFTPPRTVAEFLDALVALEPGDLAGGVPLSREWIEEIVVANARLAWRDPDLDAETALVPGRRGRHHGGDR